jgi:hypothetical protein
MPDGGTNKWAYVILHAFLRLEEFGAIFCTLLFLKKDIPRQQMDLPNTTEMDSSNPLDTSYHHAKSKSRAEGTPTVDLTLVAVTSNLSPL